MTFRIDDISIHLMPSQKKDPQEEKEDKEDKKPPLQCGPYVGGHPCTEVTGIEPEPEKESGKPGCLKHSSKQTATQGFEALAFLKAQLRETLAPPSP